MGNIENHDVMEDFAYQDGYISLFNGLIEIQEITSLCDTVIEGQQVDATILLSINPVEKE